MEQISKLEEALYNIQFEQHWLEAQTDRQAIGNIFFSKNHICCFFTCASNDSLNMVCSLCSEREHEQKSSTQSFVRVVCTDWGKSSPSVSSASLV